MITHNHKRLVFSSRQVLFCATTVSTIALCGAPHSVLGQSDGWPVGAPTLQRMLVLDDKSYAMDYAEPRGIDGRALVIAYAAPSRVGEMTSAFLFGRNLGIVKPPDARPTQTMQAYRWTLGGHTVFATQNIPIPSPKGGVTWALKFSIDLLVAQPDGTAMFDSTKLPGPIMWGGGKAIPHIGLEPIGAYHLGLSGWKLGDMPLQSGLRMARAAPKQICYDFCALDDVRLELYMTADGKLSRWLFDGEEWTLRENYSVKVDGPFLICNGGKGIVTKRENIWCLVGDLSEKQAKVQRIVKSSPDEPFTLVEDKVTGIDYFEYRGVLYDENGVDLCPIPRDTDAASRLKAITEFVRSRRSH